MSYLENITMKMSLVELYQLIGDNKGITFNYEELPGVTVTVGFSIDEDEYNPEEDIELDDEPTEHFH
jgi:hypothetical protein